MRNFGKEHQEGFEAFEEDEYPEDDKTKKIVPVVVPRALSESELNAQFEERRNRRVNRD